MRGKKTLLVFGFAFFLCTFIFPKFVSQVHADDISPTSGAFPTPIVTTSPGPVEYTLPYPGLLPDNPLYPLKTFRDRIISFFISDPLKKAEFDLLLSDKRVNAAYYLYQESGDKEELINTTLSKAINYFEDGIGQIHQAKTQGQNTNVMQQTFLTAAAKYQEVLHIMKDHASPQLRKDTVGIEDRITTLQKSLKAPNTQ